MTAETLHDAIGLLPSDLIAEADRIRCRKKKVIHWQRYAAMAACFVLVLGCGLFAMQLFAPKGATECAAQAPAAAAPMAPVMDEAPAEEVMEDTSLHGGAIPKEAPDVNKSSGSGGPTAERTAETEEGSRFFYHRVETPVKPTTVSFSSSSTVALVTSSQELETYLTDKAWIYDFSNAEEICAAFDEAWFEDHDLLLMTVMAAHPDFPYTVTAIENISETDPMGWDWAVLFTSDAEDHPEEEITTFHLLTELEKGLISPEDSILTVADSAQ